MMALYPVLVTHARLRPRPHRLKYRVPYLLLDLAAPPPPLRFFSRNRFNLFSLHDADYGDGKTALPDYARAAFTSAGLEGATACMKLLTMPRCLGCGFNPLSLYLGYDAQGQLRGVLYEVNNTFGQRHSYLAAVPAQMEAPVHHGGDKSFYVSPFMEMAQRYDFTLTPPGETLGLRIMVSDHDGPLLYANMAGHACKLTDAALLRLALATPWLGVKILAAIHWEAFKLWLKRTPLQRRPPAPVQNVSVLEQNEEHAA
jgi:uncharacterized protein